MRNKILIDPIKNGFDVCVHRVGTGFTVLPCMTLELMQDYIESFHDCEVYVDVGYYPVSMKQFCIDEGYTPIKFRNSPDTPLATVCGVLYVHFQGYGIEEELQSLVNLESVLVDNQPMSKWVYATPLIAVILVALCLKVFS